MRAPPGSSLLLKNPKHSDATSAFVSEGPTLSQDGRRYALPLAPRINSTLPSIPSPKKYAHDNTDSLNLNKM